jgi:hypothetical protein
LPPRQVNNAWETFTTQLQQFDAHLEEQSPKRPIVARKLARSALLALQRPLTKPLVGGGSQGLDHPLTLRATFVCVLPPLPPRQVNNAWETFTTQLQQFDAHLEEQKVQLATSIGKKLVEFK